MKREWSKVSKISQELNIDEKVLPNAYYEANLYANE